MDRVEDWSAGTTVERARPRHPATRQSADVELVADVEVYRVPPGVAAPAPASASIPASIPASALVPASAPSSAPAASCDVIVARRRVAADVGRRGVVDAKHVLKTSNNKTLLFVRM